MIAVALDAGVMKKTAFCFVRQVAQLLRIVFTITHVECCGALLQWRQQVVDTGNRAVVEEGWRRPHAVQRAGFVGPLIGDAKGHVEAVVVCDFSAGDIPTCVEFWYQQV